MEGRTLLSAVLLAGDMEGLCPSKYSCHTLEGPSTLCLTLLISRRAIIIVLALEDIGPESWMK